MMRTPSSWARLGLLVLAASTGLASAPPIKKSNSEASTSHGVINPVMARAVAAKIGSKPATHPLPGAALMPASASYSIDWYSINGGGIIAATSPNFNQGSSAGQSVAGATGSTNYQMGIGFWIGAGGCNCPNQGDINGDAVIDVFDVIGVIGIAFSGNVDPQDPGCPKTRGDVNNDGATDVFDVIYLIATAFSGGPNPVTPCGP